MSVSEQVFDAQEIHRARIQCHSGDVHVYWSDVPQVRVRGEFCQARVTDDNVQVDQLSRGTLRNLVSGSDIEVWLPRHFDEVRVTIQHGDAIIEEPHGELRVRVDHGDTRIAGGDGSINARTGAGDLHLRDFKGTISYNSGAGSAQLRDLEGDVDMQLGVGDVQIGGGSGAVDVKTGNGDTRIRDRASTKLILRTGAGDVSIKGGSSDETQIQTGAGDVECATSLGVGEHRFVTGSGDTSIEVPRGLSARLEVTTARGEVESEVPLVSVGKRGPKSLLGRRFVGSIGDGEERGEINIRAVHGNVQIRWLRGQLGSGEATQGERRRERREERAGRRAGRNRDRGWDVAWPIDMAFDVSETVRMATEEAMQAAADAMETARSVFDDFGWTHSSSPEAPEAPEAPETPEPPMPPEPPVFSESEEDDEWEESGTVAEATTRPIETEGQVMQTTTDASSAVTQPVEQAEPSERAEAAPEAMTRPVQPVNQAAPSEAQTAPIPASRPNWRESEERAILASLAAGSISVDEASRLLDALDRRSSD